MHEDKNFSFLYSTWPPQGMTWLSRLGCWVPEAPIQVSVVEVSSLPQVGVYMASEMKRAVLQTLSKSSDLPMWYGQGQWHTGDMETPAEAWGATVGSRSPFASLVFSPWSFAEAWISDTVERLLRFICSSIWHLWLWHNQGDSKVWIMVILWLWEESQVHVCPVVHPWPQWWLQKAHEGVD